MIHVRNLWKAFGSLSVLEDVSLEIEEGETMAVIGRSGEGKSVLLKHMVGLLKPDRGTVEVDGTDIHELSYRELRRLRQRFGVLFQGGALFDSLSSYENVAFPLRQFSDFSESEIDRQVRWCLEVVNLEGVGEKKPSELSGGMRKRVALARAIALEPQYILYDEPTSGLDPETSNTIDELIRSLADQLNVTSIVITHDMHSVLNVADRAALLHDRKMHWIGTIDELHHCQDPVVNRFVRANEYQIGPAALSD